MPTYILNWPVDRVEELIVHSCDTTDTAHAVYPLIDTDDTMTVIVAKVDDLRDVSMAASHIAEIHAILVRSDPLPFATWADAAGATYTALTQGGYPVKYHKSPAPAPVQTPIETLADLLPKDPVEMAEAVHEAIEELVTAGLIVEVPASPPAKKPRAKSTKKRVEKLPSLLDFKSVKPDTMWARCILGMDGTRDLVGLAAFVGRSTKTTNDSMWRLPGEKGIGYHYTPEGFIQVDFPEGKTIQDAIKGGVAVTDDDPMPELVDEEVTAVDEVDASLDQSEAA